MRKQGTFKYDLREILFRIELDDAIKHTLLASIIAKGSRSGIQSAKEYVKEMSEEYSALTPEVIQSISRLLDHYTKYR